MSDKNFKLRQMFNDYLDCLETNTPFNRSANPSQNLLKITGLTEIQRKSISIRKITQEEMEIFNSADVTMRPVLLKEEKDISLQYLGKCAELKPEDVNPTAKKVARCLQKFQILEHKSMMAESVRQIRAFFVAGGGGGERSRELVAAFDRCILTAIQLVLTAPETQTSLDAQMREFLRDTFKARRVLLDTILKQPDFLPASWGGNEARNRLRVSRLKNHQREMEMRSKMFEDLEKSSQKSLKSRKSQIYQTIVVRRNSKTNITDCSTRKLVGSAEKSGEKTITKTKKKPGQMPSKKNVKPKIPK
ncbi:unnamed protein product [Caenorhabditis angaria]|uniref:DUF7774 domain-containing protein n=1 Tax=Caenorhabditis angaria TaxID=860376 RepID=A0A9P1MTX9_9PELO|nr:unnamed protein product [Caenorhabditis angaria]